MPSLKASHPSSAAPFFPSAQALTKKDAPALLHHSMETLDTASALQVFRQCHGFTGQQLQQLGLCELEQQLLQACSGLPLALQVIGGALCEEEDTSAADTYKLWQVRAVERSATGGSAAAGTQRPAPGPAGHRGCAVG